MRASTRRSLALLSAVALGLAACGDDGGNDDPAAVDGTDQLDAEQMPDDMAAPEPPSFGDDELEDGEVVPGVKLDLPEGGTAEGGPVPTGAGFAAQYEDQSLVVLETINTEISIDELTAGVDQIEASGAAEVLSGPDEIDIPGADEARIVEVEAEGGILGTLILATVGEHALSLAIERPEGGIDADAIVASLELDGDRFVEAQAGPDAPLGPGAPAPGGEGQPAPDDAEAPEPEDDDAQG